MISSYKALRIETLARKLLEIESTDSLGIQLPGVTSWEKLSESYQDHLKRKAKLILTETDTY